MALFLVQPTMAVLFSNSGGEENEEAEEIHSDKVHGERLKVIELPKTKIRINEKVILNDDHILCTFNLKERDEYAIKLPLLSTIIGGEEARSLNALSELYLLPYVPYSLKILVDEYLLPYVPYEFEMLSLSYLLQFSLSCLEIISLV